MPPWFSFRTLTAVLNGCGPSRVFQKRPQFGPSSDGPIHAASTNDYSGRRHLLD